MLEENAKNKLTKEQKRIKFKEKTDKDQELGIYGYFLKINKIYDVENYNRFNSWIKIFKIYDVENYNRFNSWIKIFCKKYKIAGFLIYFFLN